jgi:hypothetical protein
MRKIVRAVLICAFILSSAFAMAGDQNRVVYVAGSGSGKKYHLENCRTLRNSEKIEITVENAKKRGYSACGVCKPGD